MGPEKDLFCGFVVSAFQERDSFVYRLHKFSFSRPPGPRLRRWWLEKNAGAHQQDHEGAHSYDDQFERAALWWGVFYLFGLAFFAIGTLLVLWDDFHFTIRDGILEIPFAIFLNELRAHGKRAGLLWLFILDGHESVVYRRVFLSWRAVFDEAHLFLGVVLVSLFR